MAQQIARLMISTDKKDMHRHQAIRSEVYAKADGSGKMVADGPTILLSWAPNEIVIQQLVEAIDSGRPLPSLSDLINGSTNFADQWNWRTTPSLTGYSIVDSIGKKQRWF